MATLSSSGNDWAVQQEAFIVMPAGNCPGVTLIKYREAEAGEY